MRKKSKHVNKYRTIFSRFSLAADLGLVSAFFILLSDVVNGRMNVMRLMEIARCIENSSEFNQVNSIQLALH